MADNFHLLGHFGSMGQETDENHEKRLLNFESTLCNNKHDASSSTYTGILNSWNFLLFQCIHISSSLQWPISTFLKK